VFKKKWLFILLIIGILALSGCTYSDRIREDFHVTDIWGDDAEFNTLTLNGRVTLQGDGKVWLEFRPDIDFTTIRAQGKPTWVTRGIFGGFSLPIYAADNEELFFDMCIPNRWYQPAWIDLGTVGDKPMGMAEYGDNLYIPCEGDNNVWMYDSSTFSISGNVDDNPNYACTYGDNLYVSCAGGDDTVWVYDGIVWSKSGDVGNNPRGMATYDDNLYVACSGDDTVWVFNGTVWALSGNVGTSPEYMAEYDGDLYVGCGGVDDDVWIYNGLAWAKDDDVGNNPQEFHEHDGDLYVNCYNDDTLWIKSGGAWALFTNVMTTLGNEPVGLEEYNGDLFSACQNEIWSDISNFWNMNVDFVAHEPMFLKEYDGKLYAACSEDDEIWVYEGETAWIHVHCWINDAQGAATDAFRLYIEYESYTAGVDIVPAISDEIVIEQITGIALAKQSYIVEFPLNMRDIENDDNIALRLARIASSDEIVDEVIISHFGVLFLCDKLGNTMP